MSVLVTKKKQWPALKPETMIWGYYLVCLCMLLSVLKGFFDNDYQSIVATEKYLFKWIPANTDINLWLSFISPLLMILLVSLFPFLYFPFVRVIWAFLTYIIVGFLFNYVLGHSKHMYVWISLFLALFPGDLRQELTLLKIKPYLRAVQVQLLLLYGLAGIWKLIGLFQSFFNTNISAGSDFIKYSMAHEYINSNVTSGVSQWLLNFEFLLYILSLLVLITQVGSIIVIFFPRLYRLWGFLLVMFHIATLPIANVIFYWSIPPILVLLVSYRHTSEDYNK